MPTATNWSRKSVSQLVQHYQSCADLSSCKKAEQKHEVSGNCVDDGWRSENRKSQVMWGSGRLSGHSRSRSMDFLPQKDTVGTRALCALFESKATLQQNYNSSPSLNSFSAVDGKARIDFPLQDSGSHNITPKNAWIQRTTQEDIGKPMNGRYSRSARHPHDDKHNSSVSSSRATTSPSVRDRSALYLSRAAADSTGGPVHPEVTENSATRTKRSKFQPPTKEMCSACLTPVYPMEKMVASKLTLHHKCFSCKYCKKKLSIHNYSSLHGEFYCVSHYQQLFKRKGNYDEAFGHTPHKDRWFNKNKAADEPDARSPFKMIKNYLNCSAESIPAKSTESKSGHKSVADVKGKLKISWPPEKKNPGVSASQRSFVSEQKIEKSEKDNKATGRIDSGQWKTERVQNRMEVRDMRVKEQSKSQGFVSSEIVPLKKPNQSSGTSKARHIHDTITARAPEKLISVVNQTKDQKKVSPNPKPSKTSTSNGSDKGKVRKSVHFAPNIEVVQCEETNQPTSEGNSKTIPHESDKIDKSDNKAKIGINNHKIEVSNEKPENKNYEVKGEKTKQEKEVEVQNSQEIPRIGNTTLTGPTEEAEPSLNSPNICSAQGITSQIEPPETEASAKPAGTQRSEDFNPAQNSARSQGREAISYEKNENQQQTSDSTQDEPNSIDQKKPLPRTNSRTKLGSLSKGKSPLSKLFTSSGNDKPSKVEPKDTKKPDVKQSSGLFGKLFHSSSDTTKVASQDKARAKPNTATKKAEKENDGTKDEQIQKDVSKIASVEPYPRHLTITHPSKPDHLRVAKAHPSIPDLANFTEIHPSESNSSGLNESRPPVKDDSSLSETHLSKPDSSNLTEIHLSRQDPSRITKGHPSEPDPQRFMEAHLSKQDTSNLTEANPSELDSPNLTEVHLSEPNPSNLTDSSHSEPDPFNQTEAYPSRKFPSRLTEADPTEKDHLRLAEAHPSGKDNLSLTEAHLSELDPSNLMNAIPSKPGSSRLTDASPSGPDPSRHTEAHSSEKDPLNLTEAQLSETDLSELTEPHPSKKDQSNPSEAHPCERDSLNPTVKHLSEPDLSNLNQSQFSEHSNFDLFDEPSSVPQMPLTEQNDNQTGEEENSTGEESDLQGIKTSGLSTDDPGVPLKSHPDILINDPFTDYIFDKDTSSALFGNVPNQINAEESSPKPNMQSNKQDKIQADHQELLGPCNSSDLLDTPTLFSSSLTDTAVPTAAAMKELSLFDFPSEVVPAASDSAPLKQNDSSDPFWSVNPVSEQSADFDTFRQNDLFSLPLVNADDQTKAPTSYFTDDIFGVSDSSGSADAFPQLLSTPAPFNSQGNLLVADAASTAAPSAPIDLFGDGMFTAPVPLLSVAEPSGVNVDTLMVSENSTAEQKSESSSWIDDLLG
ncbi:xin actin-binding repeat-containing protein 1 isoform X7 [Oryzias latipes]